jgi:hypothetical protein
MKEQLKILAKLLKEDNITLDEFILLCPEKEALTSNWYPYQSTTTPGITYSNVASSYTNGSN